MPLNETQARENLKILLNDFDKLSADERKTMSEASVVRQFIDRLLEEVLGWPIKDPQRYKYEMHTQAGRPDLTLFPENGGVIFVEAKRFGIIKQLEAARFVEEGVITPGQMALPGMAIDRNAEEQQAINYAFANGGTWAILTNFEKLRLFNARRDWLVLSFERPYAYLTEFDQLWQLSYENVVRGSLDALSNQRYARDIDSTYLDFVNDWRERLAQDVLKRRSLNRWAFDTEGNVKLVELRSVVQRFLDRLVIARFAEDWLVIPPGTLRQFADMRRGNIYTQSMDSFLDTFFQRFDVEHNSALFAYGLVDEASFSDEALLPLLDKLYEVRYRAMPADILGNTYEQYLGKALALQNGSITTRDNLETRKKQGSYYTPQVIVKYIVDNSLGRYLYGTSNGQADGEPLPDERRKTSADIRDLKVLDSACGSGSFLIYAYYVLAGFYESELARLQADYEARVRQMAANFDKISLDDRINAERVQQEQERIRNYPRLILETHLYGVDLDPQAAEIATVNLMMRAMEGRHHEKRLPLILGQSVKVGNGLVGLKADDARMQAQRETLTELIAMRHQLTTDPDKGKPPPELNREFGYNMSLEEAMRIPNPTARDRMINLIIAREENPDTMPVYDPSHESYEALKAKTRVLTRQLDEHLKPHFSDLDRVRPFHWGAEFPEVFYNADGTLKDNPGFTIVFGNPPWEILKPDLREFYAQFDERIEGRLNRTQAEKRIIELDEGDLNRKLAWEASQSYAQENVAYFRHASGYEYLGTGDIATHKLFVERMYGLLQNEGRLGYVIPSGIYTDLGTKELREMLLNSGRIESLISLTNGATGGHAYFADIHRSFKITFLHAQKGVIASQFRAAFRIDPRHVPLPSDFPSFVANPDIFINMDRDLLKRFSPDSLSIMEFRDKVDYEIAAKIYKESSVLGEKSKDSWNVEMHRELHTTDDRHLFNTVGSGLPLYEGATIHQFDSFYGSHEYWVNEAEARKEIIGKNIQDVGQTLYYQLPRMAYREIAPSTNMRTLIASFVPPKVFCNHKLFIVHTDDLRTDLFLLSLLNSFTLDYILRFKVSTSVSMYIVKSLPIPRLTVGNPTFDAIVERAARLTCTRPEFADLWQSVTGSEWDASKGATDPAERQQLRDEIDALVAHLYGLTREEYDHILGTFPLVFPDTDAGRARLAATLAAYDAS